jgi:5-methylcytosine-specific restriction enzyme subunit McrC
LPTPRIELREADQPTLHRMPREVAAGLVAAGIAAVAPTFVADEYRVSGVRKVGVVRIAGRGVVRRLRGGHR